MFLLFVRFRTSVVVLADPTLLPGPSQLKPVKRK